MSARLQGKIHRFSLITYAKAIEVHASKEALRTAKHLFLALAEHYNDDSGQCNPSIPILMNCLELSHGSTVNAKNLLIKLGLISVIKNAKGGRNSCWYDLHFPRYEEFSRPANNIPSHPVNRMLETTPPTPSHPADKHVPSEKREVSTAADGIRTLIEALDIPLIKSLRSMKNIEGHQETIRLGHKYHVPINKSTPIWMIQEALLKIVNEQNKENPRRQ